MAHSRPVGPVVTTWQSIWQSGRCHRAGRDATRQTRDRTSTCGDAPREHQADGSCLTTDLARLGFEPRGAHHQLSTSGLGCLSACLATQRAARQLVRLERRALAQFMAWR